MIHLLTVLIVDIWELNKFIETAAGGVTGVGTDFVSLILVHYYKTLVKTLHFSDSGWPLTCYCQIDRNGTVFLKQTV